MRKKRAPKLPEYKTPKEFIEVAQAYVDAQYDRMKAGIAIEAIEIPYILIYEP